MFVLYPFTNATTIDTFSTAQLAAANVIACFKTQTSLVVRGTPTIHHTTQLETRRCRLHNGGMPFGE
jgi:hypothetical protein